MFIRNINAYPQLLLVDDPPTHEEVQTGLICKRNLPCSFLNLVCFYQKRLRFFSYRECDRQMFVCILSFFSSLTQQIQTHIDGKYVRVPIRNKFDTGLPSIVAFVNDLSGISNDLEVAVAYGDYDSVPIEDYHSLPIDRKQEILYAMVRKVFNLY